MPKLECSIDMKNIERMIKDLNRLETTEIVIGFDDTDHGPEDDLTNSELALIMERGVRGSEGEGQWKIPPRPFLFRSGTILLEDIDNPSKLVVSNTLKGNAGLVNSNLEKIGKLGVEAVQESIDRQGFRKLSPTTIRIKRAKNSRYATKQLLDSGSLYESVTYDINRRK